MSLLKHYTTSPEITCSFGATELEAQEKKAEAIIELKNKGAVIVPGYEYPEEDKTLHKLKNAANGYNDIYGNQTKYWDIIYR